MKPKNSKKSIHKRQSYMHHVLPILVWLLAVAAVAVLIVHRTETVLVHGMVIGRTYNVASVTPGRVKSIRVKLNDPVEPDQVLAIIDTLPEGDDDAHQLDLQRSTINAEIEHLQAQIVPLKEELQAEATRLEQSRVGDHRRFSLDVENQQVRILELKAKIESDRLSLDDVGTEIPPTQQLVLDNALAPIELKRLQQQQQTLMKSIDETQALLKQTQDNLDMAIKRRDEFTSKQLELPSAEHAVEVIRKEIVVQQRRLEEISAKIQATRARKNVEIRAPFAGVVSHLYCELNEVADVNQPLLTIAQKNPNQVVAYVDQSQVDLVHAGMTVDLVKNSNPPEIATNCPVVSLAPVVEQIPAQLWLHPNLPQWGRAFVIQAPTTMNLLVGEKIGIRGLKN